MNPTIILRDNRDGLLLRAILGDWRAAAEAGNPWELEVRPYKSKRSTDQNRFYWELLHQIEEAVWVEGRQYGAEIWHHEFKRRLLPHVDLPSGTTMPVSTSTLNTKEFSIYMDQVQALAATELGVTFIERV